jgi:hypothetical protein
VSDSLFVIATFDDRGTATRHNGVFQLHFDPTVGRLIVYLAGN